MSCQGFAMRGYNTCTSRRAPPRQPCGKSCDQELCAWAPSQPCTAYYVYYALHVLCVLYVPPTTYTACTVYTRYTAWRTILRILRLLSREWKRGRCKRVPDVLRSESNPVMISRPKRVCYSFAPKMQRHPLHRPLLHSLYVAILRWCTTLLTTLCVHQQISLRFKWVRSISKLLFLFKLFSLYFARFFIADILIL